MGSAFTEQADFSNMVTGAKPGDLMISQVVHKMFVDINEEDTEAAASTLVGVGVTSVPSSIKVDRPLCALKSRCVLQSEQSYTKDEGRPLETGLQEQVSNHRMLLR